MCLDVYVCMCMCVCVLVFIILRTLHIKIDILGCVENQMRAWNTDESRAPALS
jgi:hypothetical protein